ncbi:GtrA family protein [Ruegeria sp. R13_0]|uniref:GtrA family protein n=1 Tax=Ruegeria sp. R13_0 TaxID=2821099 RepID=UPI001ADCA46D|nr:GtrA family protein [Ruegeria sp. R13_0]MBO9436775.1 GtrA family protein [Ruegeria sp. R13_0]
MDKLLRLTWLVTKFGLVGVSSVAMYFALLAVMRSVIQDIALLAGAAYLGSAVWNYTLQSRLTFSSVPGDRWSMFRYVVMHVICMAVNSTMMYTLVVNVNVNLWLSQSVTTICIASLSFTLSYLWVYRSHE